MRWTDRFRRHGPAVLGLGFLYLAFAVSFAVTTPVWQAPDEPAHFNYAWAIAMGSGLPVLQPGDYDQSHLERLVSERFPSGETVDGLRYENHQPPLFYLAAAVVLRVVGGRDLRGQVLSVRLFSAFTGLGLVVLGYAVALRVFSGSRSLAVAAAALVALLPQHIAMLSAVNNDGVAELGLGVVLLLSIRLTGVLFSGRLPGSMFWIWLGLALAWVLLAKTTVYVAALLPLAAVAMGSGKRTAEWRRAATGLFVSYGLAILVSAPWFLRNLAVYGGFDIFGLGRHAAVVAGQPRVENWDWWQVQQSLGVLFQSFWVQLGWMSVPANANVYGLLAVFAGLAAAGVAVWLVGGRQGIGGLEQREFGMLGGLFILVAAQLAFYNLQFSQPQGRYLFPALIPIACLTIVGLSEFVTPRLRDLLAAAVVAGLAALNLYALRVLVPHLGGG